MRVKLDIVFFNPEETLSFLKKQVKKENHSKLIFEIEF